MNGTRRTLIGSAAPGRRFAAALLATFAWATAGSAAHAQAETGASVSSPDLSQGASSFDPAVAAEIQVKRVRTGHLLVRPVVNGIDAGWFIFDTGAGICVVSTPHVEELKLTAAGGIDTVGVGGAASAQLHRAATLVLGPLTLRDEPIMTTDLSFLKEHLGEDIVGVIGYGLLTQCVAEIDLLTPRIALHDPKGYALAAGSWTAITLDDRVPGVDAIFEGRTARFRLDTGANSFITFHEPAVREWKLLDGRDVSDAKLGGVGGFVAAKKGTLASFELGGVRRENVPAEFALEAKGVFAESSRAGNIGAGFLAQFVMVVDYSNKRIALRPRDAK
jgi:predicted aspartyl protease